MSKRTNHLAAFKARMDLKALSGEIKVCVALVGAFCAVLALTFRVFAWASG